MTPGAPALSLVADMVQQDGLNLPLPERVYRGPGAVDDFRGDMVHRLAALGQIYALRCIDAMEDSLADGYAERFVARLPVAWRPSGGNVSFLIPHHTQLDAAGKDVTILDPFYDRCLDLAEFWCPTMEVAARAALARVFEVFPQGLTRGDLHAARRLALGDALAASLDAQALEGAIHVPGSGQRLRL